MSMELMVLAMKTKVGNPLRKLVLLKLADNASDQGECWPSIPYIAEECEISERSVQNHISALVDMGLVLVESRRAESGLNKSNVFTLNLSKSYGANAAPSGAGDSPSGANAAPSLVQEIPNSGAGAAPRTSQLTSQLESVNKNIKKGFDLSALSQLPSDEVWQDFLTHRKNIKAKLTQSAVNLLIGELNKAIAAGFTTDYALSYVMAQGWRGFKYEWMQNKGVQAQSTNPEHWNSKQSWDGFL